MNRNFSTSDLNSLWRQGFDNVIKTSLPDNWNHPRKMAHSHSMPRFEPTTGSEVADRFNQNCLDCRDSVVPRHDMIWDNSSEMQTYDYQMSHSSSAEGLEDSCIEDNVSKFRSMSVDSGISATDVDMNVLVQLSPPYDSQERHSRASRVRNMSVDEAIFEDEGDANSCVVRFTLHESDIESESEAEQEDSTSSAKKQGCTQTNSLTRVDSFLSLIKRAASRERMLGLQDRTQISYGVRHTSNAVTTPGDPADLSTSVDLELGQQEQVEPKQRFLCAERVTQMTKTYNDIEAVTRLLEEKERDLELAARIGQTLLSKNKELSTRGDGLEEQLNYANEKINQLRHDLSMKDELLKFYCEDLQDQSPTDGSPGSGPNLGKINIDMLQKKVCILEEENLSLRLESAQLRTDTETYEEKEKKLVEDCLQQLAEVQHEMEVFAGELKIKSEENSRQKEEITSLLAQIADQHRRVRQLTVENMDLSEKLQASQESQRQLTKQLSSQQDRYDELFEMLEEAQDELRGHRNRDNPKARRHLYASAALPGASSPLMNSLASELENSLNSLQQDSDEKEQRRVQNWKVFETARAAKKAASKSSGSSSVRMTTSVSGSQAPSNHASSDESFHSEGYSADMDSIYGSCSELGRAGIPGSNDLESALRRLALRRANEMNERDYMENHRGTRSESVSPMMTGMTPDGRASPASCYSYLGMSNTNHSAAHFKMSDKLQIVKPLEGSMTLRHWQRLAQPHLGGLFEQRDGVKVKGERRLDLEGEVYTLSDFEEDDVVDWPSRRAADSSTIYTFTDSVVSHPSEHSQQLSASWSNDLQMLGTSTPTSQSMAMKATTSSTSSGTYTMSLGLAAILQERGLSSSPSCVRRPIASCSVMPPHTTTQSTVTTSSAAAAAVNTTDSDSGAGFLGKLINTGYSLLWNSSESPISSTAHPVSSDLTTQSSPEHLAGGAISTQSKSTAGSQVLSGSSTGVLGAIATFRKNGIL